MATELFTFTVTFTNGFFEVFEAGNGNLVAVFPEAQLDLKTHPTNGNFYYMGTSGNMITLDFTQCTNLTVASRKAQMDAILALATAAPLGAVTIAGPLPLPVSLNYKATNIFSLSATAAASGNMLILRGNGATITLLSIMGSSSTSQSSGTFITILQGATVTGGVWATPAGVGASLIQANTGGVVTLGSNEAIIPLNSIFNMNLASYLMNYLTLVPFVIQLTQTEVGSSSVSIMWTE